MASAEALPEETSGAQPGDAAPLAPVGPEPVAIS